MCDNFYFCFFFSSRRRHTRLTCDWSSDVCSSDLIEVMGQRLIFMLGSVLIFAFALVPAAALFALVLFVMKIFITITAAVPLAAAFAATAMAAEAAFAVWWMGRLFERFDLSAESLS